MITEGKHLQEKGVKKIQKKSKSMTPAQSSCSSIFTYFCVFIFLHLIVDKNLDFKLDIPYIFLFYFLQTLV